MPSSLRTADVFPVVASLGGRDATTGNTSAVRRLGVLGKSAFVHSTKVNNYRKRAAFDASTSQAHGQYQDIMQLVDSIFRQVSSILCILPFTCTLNSYPPLCSSLFLAEVPATEKAAFSVSAVGSITDWVLYFLGFSPASSCSVYYTG